jgi:hypothetical protein
MVFIIGDHWRLIREQWWLIGKQWWLTREGSSGDSLVGTPHIKTAILGWNPVPTVDCQSLYGLPSGMVFLCTAEVNKNNKGFCSTKTKKRKK